MPKRKAKRVYRKAPQALGSAKILKNLEKKDREGGGSAAV
jgi:hypothetical protein